MRDGPRIATQGIRGIAASPRISGYGMNLDRYLQRAKDERLIITQVETAQAVDHLPEILRTEGLDGVFIGPMDLAASMGHLGNPAHPDVQATIRRIEDTVLPTGKTLCTLTPGFEQMAEMEYGRWNAERCGMVGFIAYSRLHA